MCLSDGQRSRQLQEKCQEQRVDLYMTFADLSKAFDTVCHYGLGCPAKNIAMVQQFHDDFLAGDQINGEYSLLLPVTQIKLCIPTLISILSSAMLTGAFQRWFQIAFRFEHIKLCQKTFIFLTVTYLWKLNNNWASKRF